MLGNTLRQTARAFRTSTRGFKSSAVSRGGGAGGHVRCFMETIILCILFWSMV